MEGCGLPEIYRILTNNSGMEKPFLCKNTTSKAMVGLMEQAWNFLLKCTLKPGTDANNNTDSIISIINMMYSVTISRQATCVQTELYKLFKKIACIAFAAWSTSPTKNIPSFDAHMIYHVEGEACMARTRHCLMILT